MTEQQWAQCVAYRRCPPREMVRDFAFSRTPQLRHPHAWSLTYTCRARLRGTRRAAPASRRHSSAHCSGRLAPRTPSMPAVPSLPALPTRACDRGRGSVQVCCDVDPLGRKRLRDGGLGCAGYVKSSQVTSQVPPLASRPRPCLHTPLWCAHHTPVHAPPSPSHAQLIITLLDEQTNTSETEPNPHPR